MSMPFMPLYVADYLADTTHLNAAQSGAYLHLIMHYWRVGGLPRDDEALARISRMTTREWARHKDIILAFFDADLRHKRIDLEILKSKEVSHKRAQSGARGGNAKALKSKDAAVASATDLPDVCHPVCSSKNVAFTYHNQSSSSVAKATDADGAAPVPSPDGEILPELDRLEDPKAVLFGECVHWLVSTGKSEGSARSMIGKLLKEAGGDAHASIVLAILRDARRERKADPAAWAMGVLKSRQTPKKFAPARLVGAI